MIKTVDLGRGNPIEIMEMKLLESSRLSPFTNWATWLKLSWDRSSKLETPCLGLPPRKIKFIRA